MVRIIRYSLWSIVEVWNWKKCCWQYETFLVDKRECEYKNRKDAKRALKRLQKYNITTLYVVPED